MQTTRPLPPPQVRGGQSDIIRRFKHYRHLLWRSKWYLIVFGATLVIISMVAAVVSVSRPHDEPATVLIGVENTAELTAVKDVSGLMQAQSDLILSRTFLNDIAQNLSLQFALRKYTRAEVFDTVRIDSAAVTGKYSIKIDKKRNDSFSVYFAEETREGASDVLAFLKRPTELFKGKLSELSALTVDGIRLVFSSRFRAAPHDFKFKIMDLQHAVEDLYGRTTVKESDSRSGVSNISVSVKGHDYRLIAEIANSIGDAFVEKSVRFKRARTTSVVSSLEKQLETVSRDLSASSEALRNFRSANPSVGLSDNIKQRIGGLSQLEKGVFDTKKSLSDAQDMLGRYEAASGDDKVRIAGEIAIFLASRDVASASGYRTELSDLVAQARDQERTYASDHPVRVENARKIESLTSNISSLLNNYVSTSKNSLAGKSSDVQSMVSELQNLPSKELELAELERRHQIFSDIYSTVLSRYNQVKVLNTGEVAEVYVMDRAVPPIPPPVSLPKLMALALIAALSVTLLPLLAYDFFDRTAHTEVDFNEKAGHHLLEGIPKIKAFRNHARNGMIKHGHGNNGFAPVTLQDKEVIVREIFRVLRTKTLLKLDSYIEKSIIVTSLEPGAGKSTVTANLAYAIARQKIKTLVIDADLRRGTLYKWFGKKQDPGLSDYINAAETPGSAAQDGVSSLIQATSIPDLFFISAGKPEMMSSELLASGRFEQLKRELEKRFSFIIVDSPPLDALADAAILAPMFSAFLIVARAGSTDIQDLTQRIAEFPIIEDKVLGYVLNSVSHGRASKYYKYAAYYSTPKT
jgi:capsular exopolysaccharide synthesis family protein